MSLLPVVGWARLFFSACGVGGVFFCDKLSVYFSVLRKLFVVLDVAWDERRGFFSCCVCSIFECFFAVAPLFNCLFLDQLS